MVGYCGCFERSRLSATDPNAVVEEWFSIHAAQPNFPDAMLSVGYGYV
jgi:hypothetical protein